MENSEELQAPHVDEIQPGMLVEPAGRSAEKDISLPTVTNVVKDEEGRAAEVVIRKGILFKKEIGIPLVHVADVEPPDDDAGSPGKLIVSSDSDEVQALAGEEPPSQSDEGLEELGEEVEHSGSHAHTNGAQVAAQAEERTSEAASIGLNRKAGVLTVGGVALNEIGPGFIAGISGRDSSAVATYAVDGAQIGYGHLWIMLLATPLLQSVQFACAKVGRIQQKG